MVNPVRIKDHSHLIAISANGKQVYANLTSKPLSTNVSNNPHLLRLAEEAVTSSNLKGETPQLEYVVDHPIGRSELIETNDADVIFYARETKTSGFTRFVKNRQSLPTGCITVSLTRDGDDEYEITNIWIGETYPVTPDHEDATAESATFWANHAVVYNGQSIVSSTLTKTSPY